LTRISISDRRLRRRGEFDSVLKQGRQTTSRNFAVCVQANECGQHRLGIVAGKKAAARAVDRNRAKRLIRETFDASLEKLGSLDIVVRLRADLRERNNAAVREELQHLLEKCQRGATPPPGKGQSD
jgi:ribonuclease P protein component